MYLRFGPVCDGFFKFTSGISANLLAVSMAVSCFYLLTFSSNGESRTISTVYDRQAQLENATRRLMQTACVALQSYSLQGIHDGSTYTGLFF